MHARVDAHLEGLAVSTPGLRADAHGRRALRDIGGGRLGNQQDVSAPHVGITGFTGGEHVKEPIGDDSGRGR